MTFVLPQKKPRYRISMVRDVVVPERAMSLARLAQKASVSVYISPGEPVTREALIDMLVRVVREGWGPDWMRDEIKKVLVREGPEYHCFCR